MNIGLGSVVGRRRRGWEVEEHGKGGMDKLLHVSNCEGAGRRMVVTVVVIVVKSLLSSVLEVKVVLVLFRVADLVQSGKVESVAQQSSQSSESLEELCSFL